MDTLCENLVIICWLYVANCRIVHITLASQSGGAGTAAPDLK